ncbi:hypothetical protein PFISCL1PPCAC_868, partial [Pristionchus fissidentatus]
VDIMIVVALSVLVSTAFAACPATYEQIAGGDCFKLFNTAETFDSAEAKCVQDHGHLASIHNVDDQAALTALIGSSTPLIGMKCTDTDRTHCTWTDETAADYDNFPGGTIVIPYGQCVHLVAADQLWWNSCPCDSPNTGFLCRVKFSAPPDSHCTPHNGGCAMLKTIAKNQKDAEADCLVQGGHLASVQSDNDQAFYKQLGLDAGLTDNLYIGLTWDEFAYNYKWLDETKYDYNKFAIPFPDIMFGECVQMLMSTAMGTSGVWTNVECSNKMAYVCWIQDAVPLAPPNCPADAFYDKGTIYSPNFPLYILPGQTCTYLLATSPGTIASVTFPTFNADAVTSLKLYSGLDDKTPLYSLTTLTANSKTSYSSTTNVMRMVFTSSQAPTGTGWQAEFTTIGVNPPPPTDPTTHCPPQQYTADIEVYSPNFPQSYPTMSYCIYYIHSRNNRKMSISFDFVDTDQAEDFVQVFDGPTTDDKTRFPYDISGNTGREYITTGNVLTLLFTSGSFNKGHIGWNATVLNL